MQSVVIGTVCTNSCKSNYHDLKGEREKYLVKYNNNIPIFITDFPASIKPFYARVNDDGQTVGLVNDCMI
jgi:aspartyl/asparaginyl-tRNA synthetase